MFSGLYMNACAFDGGGDIKQIDLSFFIVNHYEFFELRQNPRKTIFRKKNLDTVML